MGVAVVGVSVGVDSKGGVAVGRDNLDEEEGISEATLSPACQYKLNQN